MAGRGMKDQSVYELNKTQQYIMQMRPVLHKQVHCSVTEPRITESQWSQRQMKWWRSGSGRRKTMWTQCFSWADGKEHPMQKVETENEYDYYAVKIQLGTRNNSSIILK